jgi:predicted phosphodiesterase
MIVFQNKVKLSEGKRLLLVPIGDIHYNVKDCDKPRFHRLIAWLLEREEAGDVVRIVGLGDYTDPLSTSERAAFASMKGGEGAHDTTLELFDGVAAEMAYKIGSVLWPVRHMIVGLVEGHHYMRFATNEVGVKGETNTQFLCTWLGTQYLGDIALGRIELPHQLGLDLAVFHGKGSPGLNARKKVGANFPQAEVVLTGHSHDKIVGCDQGLVLDPTSADGVRAVKRYYVGTGSFMRGYVPGRASGSYIEKAALQPSELGVAVVEVKIEKRGGKWRKDFHVSI